MLREKFTRVVMYMPETMLWVSVISELIPFPLLVSWKPKSWVFEPLRRCILNDPETRSFLVSVRLSRTLKLSEFCGTELICWKFCTLPGWFGRGNRFSIPSDAGLMRESGILFPSKGCPLSGSYMVTGPRAID